MKRLILIVLLTVLGRFLPGQVFFSEDFNLGIPASWIAQNGGSTADTWMGTTGGFAGQYLNGTEFVFVNSDAAGNSPTICLDELLISPIANTAGQTVVLLEFDQYFRHSGQTDTGFVEVFDGLAWQQVAVFSTSLGTFGNPNHQAINVTAFANAAMQVRFRYNDGCAWAWYWAVDNVVLSAPLSSDAGAVLNGAIMNGRLFTSSALTSAETITMTVENYGADTLINIPVSFRVNAGPASPLETVAGPIPPLSSLSYTFTATANLAAAGTYQIEVWTDHNLDGNASNDTAFATRQQLPNLPLSLPLCQGFENAPDTVRTADFFAGISGLPELDFYTSGGAGGRLRTAAGTGFYNQGSRAITLDKSPTGSPNAINEVLLTYNMSAYDASQDLILFDFSICEHGDEVHPQDSVWVRGSDTSTWIGVRGWNSITGGVNGFWFTEAGIDLSATLQAGGQNFSSSFQIRLGQEDNFSATSPISSDGVSFDDICLSQIVNINTGISDISHPQNMDCGDSLLAVVLVVENFGLDTLVNIPVQVTVSGNNTFNMQDTLPGPLLPGATANLVVNQGSAFSGGNFTICAFTQLLGDSLQLDDTTCVQVALLAPQIANVSLDTLCQGDSASLQVIAPNPSYLYTWWDSLIGGNMLKTGTSFQTPGLLADTSFFVEANSGFVDGIGPEDNTFGSGGNYSIMSEGLVFDVLQTLVIDTVFVYPANSGTVVINILDGANNPVGTVSVAVPGPGRQAIPVGITVYPGTGYTMSGTGTSTGGLYRNDTLAVFPFLIPNALSIRNTINGLAMDGYYYFWYDWQVTVSGCAGPRTPVSVRVLDNAPLAGFSAAISQLMVAFSDTSGGTVQTWDWDFGDGNTASVQHSQHLYAQPGTYPVCLITSNSCGMDSVCDTLTVCAPLAAGFVAAPTGLNVVFSDTATDALSWHWQFGDGAVDSVANPQHQYAVDGKYEVCLTVENACMQVDSICDSLLFCAPVVAAFSFQQMPGNGLEFTFSDLSSGTVVAWAWDFGDGGTSTLTNPNHTFTTTGNLNVRLVVTNFCGEQDTLFQTVQVVGVEAAIFHSLKIFPNPNAGKFSVQMRKVFGSQVSMRIYDLPGKEVWGVQYYVQGGNILREIDLASVAKGMYYLEIEVDGRRAIRRIVVE